MAYEVNSNELVKFYYGTQEYFNELNASGSANPIQDNYLYFITDTRRIYKGNTLISGDVDVFYNVNDGGDDFDVFDTEADQLKPGYDKKIIVYEYTNDTETINSYYNSQYNHTGNDEDTIKYNAWVRGKDGKIHQLITPTTPIEAMNRLEMNEIDFPIYSYENRSSITDYTGSQEVGNTKTPVRVYTQMERNKLNSIQYNAEVNVQSDWDVTNQSSDAYIVHRPTVLTSMNNIPVETRNHDLLSSGAVEDELKKYVNSAERLYDYYNTMNSTIDATWNPAKSEIWVPLTQLNNNWLVNLEAWYRAHVENVPSGAYPTDTTKHRNIVYSIKGPGTASGTTYTGDVSLTRADMQIQYVPNYQPMEGLFSSPSNPTGTAPSGTSIDNHFIIFDGNTGYTPKDSGISTNTLNARFEGGSGTVDGITYNYPGKVDKRDGYELSKNDLTDELKAQLDNLWMRLPSDKSTTATTDRNTLYTLPPSTNSSLGGVIAGTDMDVVQNGTLNLASQSITPATYGNSTTTLDTNTSFNIPQITVNSKGVITGISNQVISFTTNASPVVGTYGSQSATLSATSPINIARVTVDEFGYVTDITEEQISFSTEANPTAGTYGSTTKTFGVNDSIEIPRVTVDEHGYITGISSSTISLGTLPNATNATPGVIIAGTDLSVSNGLLNLKTQTVTPASYGSETTSLSPSNSITIPKVTVNNKGIITGISSSTITLDTGATPTAGTYGSNTATLGYGSANKISIPRVTVDSHGLITGISSSDIDFNTFKGITDLSTAINSDNYIIIGIFDQSSNSIIPYKVRMDTLASYVQNYVPSVDDTLITKRMLEDTYLNHYLKKDESDTVHNDSTTVVTTWE